MKTKLLFSFVISLFAVYSSFAQIPIPVIGLAFEDDIIDEMDFIDTDGSNYDFEEDTERGSSVILFNGEGTGDAIGAGTNLDGTFVDVTTDAFNFDEITINLWFYCNALENWSRLLTFGTFGDGHDQLPEVWLCTKLNRPVIGPDGTDVSGQLSFSTCNSNADGDRYEIGAGVIEAATWYMVTATQDAESAKIYLDGEFKSEIATGFAPSDMEFEFGYLGAGPWPDDIFDGKMDNFTVYDHILTDEEIMALYECTGECINPVGIKDISSAFKPNVYSSNGQIYIKNVDNVEINSVQIYNILGTQVYQSNEFSEVSPKLPSNIYLVKIQSNQGDFTKKVIVQ